MALLSNSQKTIKIVVRSRRSFNDTFILLAANLSKNEDYILVEAEVVEVTPDIGYKKQYEIMYTFTDLIIGVNNLSIKLTGQDGIERTSFYTVIRNFPHEDFVTDTLVDTLPTISNPIPAHEATNIERVTQLQWTAYDVDPMLFDVFFSKSETPKLVSEDQVASIYPDLKLDAGNTYAWKVRAKVVNKGMVESPVWTFRVAYAPDVPNSPYPIHNSIEVAPNVTLLWESQSQDSNPLTYDVYFGPTSNPPIVASSISVKYLNVGTLVPNTTYYWKIVVSDNKYNTVPGPKWKFKTRA